MQTSQDGLTRRELINFHVKAHEKQPNPSQFMHKLIAAYGGRAALTYPG